MENRSPWQGERWSLLPGHLCSQAVPLAFDPDSLEVLVSAGRKQWEFFTFVVNNKFYLGSFVSFERESVVNTRRVRGPRSKRVSSRLPPAARQLPGPRRLAGPERTGWTCQGARVWAAWPRLDSSSPKLAWWRAHPWEAPWLENHIVSWTSAWTAEIWARHMVWLPWEAWLSCWVAVLSQEDWAHLRKYPVSHEETQCLRADIMGDR